MKRLNLLIYSSALLLFGVKRVPRRQRTKNNKVLDLTSFLRVALPKLILTLASAFCVLGLGFAQETVCWTKVVTARTEMARQFCVDKDGNVYYTYTQGSSAIASPYGANYLRKLSPTGAILFDKQIDSANLPGFMAISSASNTQPQRVAVCCSTFGTVYVQEFDTSGNALWSSPVPVSSPGYSQCEFDSNCNLTLQGSFFFAVVSPSGATSTSKVVLPYRPDEAIPLPNGKMLFSGGTDTEAYWGVYDLASGKELLGGAAPLSSFAYRVAASSDGAIAVLWLAAKQILKTYDPSGKLVGTLANDTTTSGYKPSKLAIDMQHHVYLSDDNPPATLKCFSMDLTSLWSRPLKWQTDSGYPLTGGADGVFYIYEPTVPTSVYPFVTDTQLYHVSSKGWTDCYEDLGLVANIYTLQSNSFGDYLMFGSVNTTDTNLVFQRLAAGANLTSVSASAISGPNQQTALTINLNALAPTGGMVVNLWASDPAIVLPSPSVTVPAGQQSITTAATVGTLTHKPARVFAEVANGTTRNAAISY